MTIYLDSDFRCHLTNDGTMIAIETDEFDGKEKAYIEGYRYVPEGQTWTRFDGVEFQGPMIAPAINYDRLMINVALDYLDDEQAESVSVLFEDWAPHVQFAVDDRRKYDGLLYKCVQAHTSQIGWEPPNVPALWARTSVDEWPEWIQPTGAQDAYELGAKVTHNSQHWISDIPANVYEPGVYGWSLAT